MLSWDELRPDFAFDGSLRDVYVLGASLNDWQTVLDALRRSHFALKYRLGGEDSALPENVADAFVGPDGPRPLLSAISYGMTINAHFFDQTEIEFDIDPREVVGQAQLDTIIDFMTLLTRATGKVATMTPENMRDAAILSVAADGAVTYTSSDGLFEVGDAPA